MVLKLNMHKETFKIIGRRNQREPWAWDSCLAGQTDRTWDRGGAAERGTRRLDRWQMCPKQKLNCLSWHSGYLAISELIFPLLPMPPIFSPVPKLLPASTIHGLGIQLPTRQLLPAWHCSLLGELPCSPPSPAGFCDSPCL